MWRGEDSTADGGTGAVIGLEGTEYPCGRGTVEKIEVQDAECIGEMWNGRGSMRGWADKVHDGDTTVKVVSGGEVTRRKKLNKEKS